MPRVTPWSASPAANLAPQTMAHQEHGKHGGKRYWLDDKRNVAKVFYGLIIVDAGWLLADLLHHKHEEFEALGGWADGGFGFYPVYGFVGAFLLVLAAKQMRRVLMRSEDYYERKRRDS